MNTKVTIGLLAMVSFPALARDVPLDKDAEIYRGVPRTAVNALAEVIRLNGYACSSVSAVTPFAISRGYYVVCNNWTYSYEVEDKGGKMIVTAD